MSSISRLGDAVPRRGNWLSRAVALRLFYACGWRIEGAIPNVPKAVVVGAPHTSNWDLALTLATAFGLGIRLHWIGKHTLFHWPIGVVLRWLGGVSVNRRNPQGFVNRIIQEYGRHEQFVVAILPEGTRYPVSHWKTGFYHIARGANVPVILVAFDYGRKVVRFGPTIYVSDDLEQDLVAIQAHYADVRGKHPRTLLQFKT